MERCQSCGMPKNAPHFSCGTEKDGSDNLDFCLYCYKDGDFTFDCDMEGMIDICIGEMKKSNVGMEESQARNMMKEIFPSLKRWK